MSETIPPIEVPAEEPDIPSPGKPPPPPPPGLVPLEPVTERPPKRTPDSRHRPPFPSYPDDAPELIRGIRGGPCAALRGYVSLDWPGRR